MTSSKISGRLIKSLQTNDNMNQMLEITSKMKFNINDYVKQNIINLSINNKQVIDNFNQVDSFDKRTII